MNGGIVNWTIHNRGMMNTAIPNGGILNGEGSSTGIGITDILVTGYWLLV